MTFLSGRSMPLGATKLHMEKRPRCQSLNKGRASPSTSWRSNWSRWEALYDVLVRKSGCFLKMTCLNWNQCIWSGFSEENRKKNISNYLKKYIYIILHYFYEEINLFELGIPGAITSGQSIVLSKENGDAWLPIEASLYFRYLFLFSCHLKRSWNLPEATYFIRFQQILSVISYTNKYKYIYVHTHTGIIRLYEPCVFLHGSILYI